MTLRNGFQSATPGATRRADFELVRRIARLEAENEALQTEVAALQALTTPTAWTAPTMTSGWTNVGGSSAPLGYRKIGDVVMVRGEISFNGSGSNPMTTLPVGFRPAVYQDFMAVNRVTFITNLMVAIDVNGTIGINGLAGAAAFGLGTILFSTSS